MIRNDFVSNSSSSSFIVAYKNDKSRKEFAEFCKNSGYGIISDIMYHKIKDRKKIIEDGCFEEEIHSYKNDYETFDVYTQLSNEIDDYIYAEMKILDLVKQYNNLDVHVVYEEGHW